MSVVASGGLGAGAIGFLVVLVLVVAAVLLFRSMLRHMRRVPTTFDPAPPEGGANTATPPATTPPAGTPPAGTTPDE